MAHQGHDGVVWRCKTTLRKYAADIEEFRRRYGRRKGEALFYRTHQPYEERVVEGNVLLREGVKAIWDLVAGNAETAFSEANARIGVGDGATPAAADTQTDLQGASKAYAAMETGYPIVGALADKKITFRSVFGAGAANFAWDEWVVDNGSGAGKTLNRKVQSFGTKSGQSWQLTLEISLA